MLFSMISNLSKLSNYDCLILFPMNKSISPFDHGFYQFGLNSCKQFLDDGHQSRSIQELKEYVWFWEFEKAYYPTLAIQQIKFYIPSQSLPLSNLSIQKNIYLKLSFEFEDLIFILLFHLLRAHTSSKIFWHFYSWSIIFDSPVRRNKEFMMYPFPIVYF